MLKKRKYNEEGKYEEAWYDSSMILYTKMVEDELENKGNLTVVFNNGGTYVYKDVTYEDYFVLIMGGTKASHGKAVNTLIKGKYEYEKLPKANVEEIERRYVEVMKEEALSSVSGMTE